MLKLNLITKSVTSNKLPCRKIANSLNFNMMNYQRGSEKADCLMQNFGKHFHSSSLMD
jgi:hypothetical protein